MDKVAAFSHFMPRSVHRDGRFSSRVLPYPDINHRFPQQEEGLISMQAFFTLLLLAVIALSLS